jgi:uncharacterized protein YdbL (DUF1318 family)
MAIRIPILTSFDPKGLKQANAAFANLQGSVRSLGSNFAAVGIALAGAGALIAKNVEALARIETINAQTAQTIKSMGNAANISATEVEALAGQLEKLTATEAESIQEGANLLLTFRNISNQAGAGNDIFNQTTAIMVDMGRALGEDAAGSAIRLGKALNDPITGLTALRKVGVGFTEEQEAQIKALQNSGDMMGAQKVILAELQAQFGGSGAAFAQTFSGQLALMGHELGTIGEEATIAVMPALTMMIEQLRELIPVIGPMLKQAIESVDWKALVTSVISFTTFLIQNAATIARVVVGVFALNTAFKLLAVASGIVKTALAIQTWFTAALASGMTLATVAAGILNVAIRLIPFVAVASAIALVVTGAVNLGNAAAQGKPYVDSYGGAIKKSGDDSLWAAQAYGTAANAANDLGNSLAYVQGIENKLTPRQADEQARRAGTEFIRVPKIDLPSFSMPSSAAAAPAAMTQSLQELISAQQQASNQEQGILDGRVSAFESFNDSVKSIFGQIKDSIMSSFELPKLGNSVNSITRNIAKLLERTKKFASSISQLSGMGLNSALLQQVIQAGPMAGSQLAAALVGGGGAFISQLNQAYGEFGNIASGIAGSGVASAFNNPTVANTYNIEVNGGVGSGPSIGKAIVDAIKSYERTSGAVWQGA